MRPFSTVFSARAVRESNEARTWLGEHMGQEFVDRLSNEVNAALDRLEHCPESGAIVRTRARAQPFTRRIILGRSGYHLYYRPHLATSVIEVVCLWHEKRVPPKV